jgi:hypothetical protein
MTQPNTVCQEQQKLVRAQTKERLSQKILESKNRSLAVLRAKAWLSQNYCMPNNILNFDTYKNKKSQNI